MASLELATIVSVSSFPVRHGFSTRALGSMGLTGSSNPEAVMERRRAMADQVGFELDRALYTVQEHGARVHAFHRDRPEGGQCVLGTDALTTDVSGQALVTYHADCLPLLYVDRQHGAVGAAHAGWRGTLAGVAGQTVQAMHLAYGSRPEELEVLVGPGICQRCYEVGPEVADAFRERYQRADRYLTSGAEGRFHLDLAAALRLQLEDDGVDPVRISVTGWCTREDDRWFSHRAGRLGRFLSAIVAP